jgi:uncharacterized protein
MNGLGVCHENGRGAARDEKEAVRWYRMAARLGDGPGMFNLGSCHERGSGVEKDEKLTVGWYREAARGGMPEAKAALRRLGVE